MNRKLIKPDPYLYIGYVPMPRTEQVFIDGAPDFMHGVRAVLCADVHLRSCTSDARLNAIVGAIAAAKADMLLLCGDYGEGGAQCARFFDALTDVDFPLGIYAVPGNNDERTFQWERVHFLINRDVHVYVNGGDLAIGGIDDYKYGAPNAAHIFRDGTGDYHLLLSHFPIIADCPADLMLCGHTHAGQVNVLGVTPYLIGFERENNLCALRGMHRAGNLQIYVSRGIGNSRLPIRLGAAPEITLIEFK